MLGGGRPPPAAVLANLPPKLSGAGKNISPTLKTPVSPFARPAGQEEGEMVGLHSPSHALAGRPAFRAGPYGARGA
eukprot:9318818-Heterocapsa_arctica.AAC.1